MILTKKENKALHGLVAYLNDALDAGDDRDKEQVRNLKIVVKALQGQTSQLEHENLFKAAQAVVDAANNYDMHSETGVRLCTVPVALMDALQERVMPDLVGPR